MRNILIVTVASMAMLFTTVCQAKRVFTGENLNRPFTIHGRLSNYEGAELERIWIVGRKRMLYLSDNGQANGTAAIERINKVFSEGGGHWFSREIYGDFTVQPLAKDIKGHMRPVCILAVKNVVIKENGKVIARKKKL